MASPRLVTGANTRVPSGADLDLDRLRGQRAAVRAALQRHPLCGFAALSARGVDAAGVAEPDQRSPTEVCDEEGHLARTQRLPEMLAEHIGGSERRRVLNGLQQLREIQPSGRVLGHQSSLRTMHRKN